MRRDDDLTIAHNGNALACRSLTSFAGLADAPQHASWINNHEIAQPPRPVSRQPDLDSISGSQVCGLDVPPSSVDILEKQMHHEVVWRFLEALQEKAGIAMSNIRETV